MPCACETKPEGCQCGTKCTCGETHEPKTKTKQHNEQCTCGDNCQCGATCKCEKKL